MFHAVYILPLCQINNVYNRDSVSIIQSQAHKDTGRTLFLQAAQKYHNRDI